MVRSVTGEADVFAAYRVEVAGKNLSFEGRDAASGVIGIYSPGDAEPIATAPSLEELVLQSRAYLGNDPDACLYLADGDGRVYQMLICEKYHQAVERANLRTAIAVAVLVFCVTCLPAAVGAGGWAVLAFLSVSAIYAVILRAGLFNVVEGAICCEIVLILILLAIPALKQVAT